MGPIEPVSHEFVDTVVRRLRREQDATRKRLDQRRADAQVWATHVAAILGEADPALRMVIGFGSTFETWRGYRDDSDIDLAIIGGDWFRLSRLVPEGTFEVSLVELDEQNEAFRNHVLTKGTVLYENSGENHRENRRRDSATPI